MRIKWTDDQLKREALGVLRGQYGYKSFYPKQWEAIEQVMQGNDVVVLMPTGGGKSLCYQVPALISDGCAIVVSPLLALMKDQVDALNDIAPAAAINSMQSDELNRHYFEQAFAGRIKLIYISPEKLLAEVDTWSKQLEISLIAIDEAHCISQWGHDFRKEYAKLGTLKQRFPDVPIMALTATADRLTRQDICTQLNIPQAHIVETSFDRPNISLSVMSLSTAQEKIRVIVRFLGKHPNQSGIIYCLSRKTTEQVAEKLTELGFNARAFHAMMPAEKKLRVQQDFLNDDVTIICATIAFGMGINKSNVRWVIHYNMPANIERYYQEIGRSGRDGLPADALMFYSFADYTTLANFAQESGQPLINMEKLKRMQQFCEATVCRRRILLNYFDENYTSDCHQCDVCNNPPNRIDGTQLGQMALSAIMRVNQNEGRGMIVDILKGAHKAEIRRAGYDKIKTFGVGHGLSFSQWNAYMLQMLQLGLFYVAYEEDNHLKITHYGKEVLLGRATVQFAKYDQKWEIKQQKPRQMAIVDDQKPLDKELFEQLRLVRLALARAQGVPPYIIFSDKVLDAMAREKPTNMAEFSVMFGVGEVKAKKYWRPFTDAIRQHLGL